MTSTYPTSPPVTINKDGLEALAEQHYREGVTDITREMLRTAVERRTDNEYRAAAVDDILEEHFDSKVVNAASVKLSEMGANYRGRVAAYAEFSDSLEEILGRLSVASVRPTPDSA